MYPPPTTDNKLNLTDPQPATFLNTTGTATTTQPAQSQSIQTQPEINPGPQTQNLPEKENTVYGVQTPPQTRPLIDNNENTAAMGAIPVDGIHVFTSTATNINQAETENSAGKVKLGKFLKVLLVMTILLSIIVGVPVGVWAVAYEKVELKFNPDLQQKIGYVIMSLPHTPKTAKFILVKSTLVGQDVKSNSFDVSAAINTSQAQDILGTNSLDFAMKGAASYYDPQNINTFFNLSLTKDFNLDFRKNSHNIYFKINKVPTAILSLFGIKSEALNPLLNKWIHYDATPLDTEARQMINDKPIQLQSQEEITKTLDKIFDKKLLAAFKTTSELNGEKEVYKLTLDLTDELLNHFFQNLEKEMSRGGTDLYLQNQNTSKPSDNVKNTKVEVMVEKDTYFISKISLYFDIVADNKLSRLHENSQVLGLTTPTLFSPGDKATVAMVANFSDYGKMVVIDVPADSMSSEDFGNKLSELMMGIYGSMYTQTQVSAGFDATRMSHLFALRNSLDLYYVDCGYYPATLEELVKVNCNGKENEYLKELPKDPDGTSYYYKVSNDKLDYDLCGNLETPRQITTICPDLRFNYHLSSSSRPF